MAGVPLSLGGSPEPGHDVRKVGRRADPGDASHSTGTALTARFAVYEGDMAAIRSRGTGKRRSMSSGASPSTVMCQPVARTSQARSRSVVQYQVARKRSNGRPPRSPRP
ncbi:hypothetical protein O1M63_01295 [Streptomyces mirabilis]|nr:hypothetical protein [Streptomyces mirabilis]